MFIKIDKDGSLLQISSVWENGFLDNEFDIDMEKFMFCKLENGKIVKATMENTKKDMPKTFNTDLTSFLIIGGTAIAGLGLLLYAKKKKD